MEETLCKIRDIYRAITGFENQFQRQYGLCLNEGMALCSLSKTEQLSSGEIADMLGLTTSNTSKIICSIEEKGLIQRMPGNKDKRQMYFSLTPEGKKLIDNINCSSFEIPELLSRVLYSL